MKGRRIAILGLGRSGLAIGKAAIRLGAGPLVFDESAEVAKPELFEEARALGLGVVLGYQPSDSWFDLEGLWTPDLVVVNPAVPKWHAGLAYAVARGIEVISEVEFAYRISPAPIVAITGTNGKSTTAVMTYLCLKACGVDAVLCGNIFGSGYPEIPLTEAAMEATADQVLVAEISSFQLEWVSQFRPIAAGITNITPDHLNRYDSFEDYAETKRRIFARYEGKSSRDEGAVWGLGQFLYVGEDAIVGDEYLEVFGQRIAKQELPFHEEHNYRNASMAALLAYCAIRGMAVPAMRTSGVPPEDSGLSRQDAHATLSCIFEGLKAFKGLAHRMEVLGQKDDIQVINNSMCTNPAAVVSSTESIPGKVHILLGGTNKGLDFEPLRAYLATSDNEAYIFGSDADDLNRMLGGKSRTYRTMQEAFEAATDLAKPSETIMLAPGCASTDQFRDFRHRGDVFKAIAMEWLNL